MLQRDSEVDCSTVRLFLFRCALKLDQQKSFKNVLLAPEHWKTDLIWAELVLIKEQICVFSTCICLNGRTFIICALNCFVIYQAIYQRDKNSRCASCFWHKSPLVLKELDPFGVFYQKHPKFHRRNLSAQFAATCFCVCWFLHSILCRRLDCFSFWPPLDLLGQKLAEHVSLHTVAFRWRDVDSFVFINVVLFPVFSSVLSLPSCRGSSSLGGYDRPQIVLEMDDRQRRRSAGTPAPSACVTCCSCHRASLIWLHESLPLPLCSCYLSSAPAHLQPSSEFLSVMQKGKGVKCKRGM